MSNYNYYKPGYWNFICETCKQKKKSDQLNVQWDNKAVCNACYDPKHPQLEERPVVIDGQAVPIVRTRPDPVFLSRAGDTTGAIIGGPNSRYWDGSNYISDVNVGRWKDRLGGEGGQPLNIDDFYPL